MLFLPEICSSSASLVWNTVGSSAALAMASPSGFLITALHLGMSILQLPWYLDVVVLVEIEVGFLFH